jgi:riboflavin synthase
VNLERAMPMNGRFGGHIVSGHIDGTGVIDSFKREENAIWVTVNAEPKLLKYIVEKGSIAIDGVSLTVAYVDDRCFKVSLIPHTSDMTILTKKKVGDKVNLENDIVGKYVEKLMSTNSDDGTGKNSGKSSGLSKETLFANGFM